MKNVNKGKILILFAAFSVIAGCGLFVLRFLTQGEKWAFYQTNPHIYTNGEITEIGTVSDRNGVELAYTEAGKRIYNENADIRKATIHTIGDSYGYISTGVQNALKDKLTGYSLVNGFYTYSGEPYSMKLTVDCETNVAAMKALGKYSGCIGICNYKTGEMICMVSTPTYDIQNEISVENAVNGKSGAVFVNRFISSTYTPGSTFKIVTAAAAIDTFGEEAYKTEFKCNYGTVIEGETLGCVGRHSSVSLKKAFSHSCNSYFSQLGLSLGKTKLKQYAEMFGFNKQFQIDGIKAAKSSFDVKDARNIDFGWASIGQYTNQMNPLQYLCAVSAVANGGEYIEPYLVETVTTNSGVNVYKSKTSAHKVISGNTAEKLADLMDYAVYDNYGKSTFGTLDVCGKTGTAEVGNGIENSLFVGFCKDEDLPLAFVVVVENGGSGNHSALTVASKTLQTAKKSLQKK